MDRNELLEKLSILQPALASEAYKNIQRMNLLKQISRNEDEA